jgi:hypothetical protein
MLALQNIDIKKVIKAKVCNNEFCIGMVGTCLLNTLYQLYKIGKNVNKIKNNPIHINPS